METWSEAIESFNELLDESGPVVIAGMEFWPSVILRECDPIAYRVTLMDYVDSEGVDSDTLGGNLFDYI